MTFVRTPKLVSLLAVVLTLSAAGSASAQTLQWNTNGSGGDGSPTALTWDANSIFFDGTNNFALSPFVVNNILQFGGATPTGAITVNGYTPNSLGVQSITFTTTGYTFAAGTASGGTNINLTGTPTINVNGAITSTINATFRTNNLALTLATNNANGLLVLGGANTHTAATTINGAGTIRLTNLNALGTTTGINLNAGTLQLQIGANTFTRPLTMATNTNLRATGAGATVTNYLANNDATSLFPVIANGATVGLGADTGRTLRFSSVITNASGTTRPTVNVNGVAGSTGAVELNSENDALRANWVVAQGTLRALNAANNGQFGNPTLGTFNAGSRLELQNTATLAVNGAGDFRFDAGSGTDLPVFVTGAAATFALERSAAGAGFSTTFGTLGVTANSTVTVTPNANNNSGVSSLIFAGTTTLAGNPTFTINNSGAGATGRLTLAGPIDGGAAARTITKAGLGELVIGATSTLVAGSGFTTQAGRLVFQTPGSTANAPIDVGAGSTVDFQNDTDGNFGSNITIQVPGSTLQVGRVTGSGAVTHTVGTLAIGASTLTVQATPAASTVGTNPGTNTGYGLTFGATTFSGNPTFAVSNNGTGVGTVTLGAINDGGVARQITKTGTGTLALGGASTLTAASQIKVDGGTLAVNATTTFGAGSSFDLNAGTTLVLGAANVVAGAPAVDVDGATLRSQNTGGVGQSQTFGQLSQTSSSTIALGTGDHTLTFASLGAYNGTLTITGFTGTAQSQGTDGKLFFQNTAAFTSTILNSIQFTGYLPGAVIVDAGGGAGFLSPVPEPSSVLGVAVAGLLAGRFIRRRLRGKAVTEEAAPAAV